MTNNDHKLDRIHADDFIDHAIRESEIGAVTAPAGPDSWSAMFCSRYLLNAKAKGELDAFLASISRAVQTLITNAEVIPDPRMEGATDCYRVPLDDIDSIKQFEQEIGGAYEVVAPGLIVSRPETVNASSTEAPEQRMKKAIISRVRQIMNYYGIARQPDTGAAIAKQTAQHILREIERVEL